MAAAGLDVFYREPGTAVVLHCQVCGTECGVERNVFGPTSHTQARARQGEWHDRFACPHSSQAWHKRAALLAFERDTAGGPHCRELLEAELRAVLRQAGLPA